MRTIRRTIRQWYAVMWLSVAVFGSGSTLIANDHPWIGLAVEVPSAILFGWALSRRDQLMRVLIMMEIRDQLDARDR